MWTLAGSSWRRIAASAALTAAATALSGAARACDGYEVVAGLAEGGRYDPAEPAAGFVALELRAAEPDLPRQCRNLQVEIEIVGGSAQDPELRGPGGRLLIEWENDELVRRNGPRWRLTNQARRALVDGETLRFRLYRAAAGQFVEAGAYAQILRFSAGDAAVTVPLSVEVTPALRFEGDSGAGVQTLDLGEISQGGRASSDFFFRTNTPVSVSLVSDNQGRLIHERGPEFGAVAYQASLSGEPVDLSRAGGALVRGRFAAGGVHAGRLTVETAAESGLYAGRYRDVVTLTFIPY